MLFIVPRSYRKEMEREGQSVPEIVPLTFQLPQEYSLFVDYASRAGPSACWIAKPVGKSQGQGIYLFTKLSRIKHFQAAAGAWAFENQIGKVAYSVTAFARCREKDGCGTSRGVKVYSQPLACGREEVRPSYLCAGHIVQAAEGGTFQRSHPIFFTFQRLVRSQLWLYREGFARFCNVKYKFSLKDKDLENSFMHLTNVAIQVWHRLSLLGSHTRDTLFAHFQKHNEDYNDVHGGKWSLRNLRLFLEGTRGIEASNQCFRDMEMLVYHACKAVQPVMLSDRHCFEMYGFDLMIDDTLKPWLLEVNGSPALTFTTENDRLLKYTLINDTLDIVMPAFADSVLRKIARREKRAAADEAGTVGGDGSPAKPSRTRSVSDADPDRDDSEAEGDESDGEDDCAPLSAPVADGAGFVSAGEGFSLDSMKSVAKARMRVGGYDLLCDETIGIDPWIRAIPLVDDKRRALASIRRF